MTIKRKPAIKYTSRDFNSIKNELVNYARKYYPDTFRDFSVNSFGSLMLDTVSYVGDILSFYLDYQVNESFLSTALEYDNVLKISRQLGLKPQLAPASFGLLTFFMTVPATAIGTPDLRYTPTLRRGSVFASGNGSLFTLLEDVNFGAESVEVVVGNVDADTSVPSTYALRARGQAMSGELTLFEKTIGEYEKFLRVEIPESNITEIVSVIDGDGNPYYEVDYLTQNTVYLSLLNRSSNASTAPNILKPISVPRRFVVEQESERTVLQFGFGSDENQVEAIDPANVLIDQHSKNYITDDSFDPARLLKTDSLGVTPSNTTLSIVYRSNSNFDTNAAINTITDIVEPIFSFENEISLSEDLLNEVRNSLELTNEESFVGSNPLPSADELKQRAFGVYSMQNRIVTKDDLIAASYNMPKKFGSIHKVMPYQDDDSFNQRNINLYVMSKNADGLLEKANLTIKNNLKTYLARFKMINDTIDILDANIINLRIDFSIIPFPDANKFKALETAKNDLAVFFEQRREFEIGEPFLISDVFSVLKNSSPVLDVVDIIVTTQTGALYADTNFNIESNTVTNGRKINCPIDSIFEIKYPNSDIVGRLV